MRDRVRGVAGDLLPFVERRLVERAVQLIEKKSGPFDATI
jgi:hypothetical protein